MKLKEGTILVRRLPVSNNLEALFVAGKQAG
jgi:hypothetical protein